MRVRKASIEDLTALGDSDFSFRVTHELASPFEGDWLTRALAVEPYSKTYGFDRTELEPYISANDKALFVVLGDGMPTGYVLLSCAWNNLASIDDLAVDTRWRGTGAAACLVRQAESWAKQKGLPGIRLETQTNNVTACRFYTRQGFVLGGYDQHLYKGLLPGTRETALFFYRFF